MPVTPDAEVIFDDQDPSPVGAHLAELTAAGAGWINLIPEVEGEQEPPHRSLFAVIFAARGEPVPMATWSAPVSANAPATVGIEHGTGPRAIERLTDAGLPLPPGWRKLSDHARRGLVLAIPSSEEPDATVRWLVAAATALTVPPLTGAWLARVYRGR